MTWPFSGEKGTDLDQLRQTVAELEQRLAGPRPAGGWSPAASVGSEIETAKEMIASLEAQICELYAEKQQTALASTSPLGFCSAETFRNLIFIVM